MQDDSTDIETSSSEYESSEANEEAPSLSSTSVVKSDLFVTGGSPPCHVADLRPKATAQTCSSAFVLNNSNQCIHRIWQLCGRAVAWMFHSFLAICHLTNVRLRLQSTVHQVQVIFELRGSPALPCPALPCPALPCPALLCPALP